MRREERNIFCKWASSKSLSCSVIRGFCVIGIDLVKSKYIEDFCFLKKCIMIPVIGIGPKTYKAIDLGLNPIIERYTLLAYTFKMRRNVENKTPNIIICALSFPSNFSI